MQNVRFCQDRSGYVETLSMSVQMPVSSEPSSDASEDTWMLPNQEGQTFMASFGSTVHTPRGTSTVSFQQELVHNAFRN